MMRSPWRQILTNIGVALVYFAAAEFGFTMAFIAEQVSIVWPPTGIALAAVALAGFGVWPGIFAGAFIANITTNEPLLTALVIASGNTLEAVVAVALLRRLGFNPALNRLRDVAGLIGTGAILGTAVSATIGVISLCAWGIQPWDRFGELWWVWWLGDGLGALVVTPIILTIFTARTFSWKSRGLELGLLALAQTAVCRMIFGSSLDVTATRSLEYLVFPFVMWAALRTGTSGTAITIFLTAAVAVLGTRNGLGPFAAGAPGQDLTFLQLFMGVVAVTGLMLAAAISETRQKHALLYAVTEGTTDAVYVKDAQGRYLMINSAGAAFIGKRAEIIIGKDDFALFSPETASKIVEHDRHVMSKGAVETTEETATAAGITRTYLSTKAPYRDHEGHVIGTIGVSRDLTEQKEVREALRMSEERYRSFAVATSEVIWQTSATGEIVQDLPGWRAFTGQSEADLRGSGWIKMLHPDDVSRVTEVWQESLKSGNPHEVEFRLMTAGGAYKYVQSRAVPVLEADGKVREWVGTLKDITERKLIEEEKARLYELADQNNRLKDEFLAMLAHELRNPLSAIRTGLSVMKLASDERQRDRTKEIIERQVTHLTRLTDDLLDVSRVTRGRIDLRVTTVDLAAIVRMSAETLRQTTESRRQHLKIHVPDTSVFVNGDPTRLEQVFTNLLQNAVKYTNHGGSIEITLQMEHGNAVVMVSDSGIGIAPDLLPRIFDLFTQSVRTLARSEGGLGIGLTIVRNLVEMHSGTIEAMSAGTGKGSTFTVRLPLVTAPLLAQPIPGEQGSSVRELRIIVVDDNHDAAETLSTMLSLQGHDVRTCYDGTQTLKEFELCKPDVILLDIGLPGMDGYEVAAKIRDLDSSGNTRLIAVTGYGQLSDKNQAFAAGFDHHIIKPVDPATLAKLLRDFQTISTRES